MIAMTATLGWIVWPIVFIVGVILDMFFAGVETGIYVTNKVRLDLHAEAGHRPAVLLRRMLASPRNLISVLLIGTNLGRYASTFSVTAMFILAGYEHRAEWLTTLVATPLFFVFADSVPKGVFQRLGSRAVYRTVYLLRVADVLFKVTGLSLLVRGLSGALMALTGAGRKGGSMHGAPGLAMIVAEGQASGVLTEFQSVMADRVARISDVRLADVMVPMSRVMSAPAGVSAAELREMLREHDYSRLVLTGEADQVVGVLDIYDALTAGDDTPSGHAAPPHVLSAETPVTDALYDMQRSHNVFAVVASGERHVGIVTIKDLVEEIVGELEEW